MKKYELRIFDRRESNPGLLIPFSHFLDTLIIVLGDKICGQWKIFQGADGYGEKVCNIADLLEHHPSLTIDSVEIISFLISGEEYFNNVRVMDVESGVEFGVVDSTWHYLRGIPDVVEKLSKYFKKIEIIKE